MIQMHAFYLFLGIGCVMLAVFLYVALSTRRFRRATNQPPSKTEVLTSSGKKFF